MKSTGIITIIVAAISLVQVSSVDAFVLKSAHTSSNVVFSSLSSSSSSSKTNRRMTDDYDNVVEYQHHTEDEQDALSSSSRVAMVSRVLAPRRRVGFVVSKIAGWVTGLGAFVANGIAADEAMEVAELPPPYVPAIFGVVLLAGVGILTSSLGNVMDEEASLGLQSGARAKKEIERSRSSYFKKR
mmetsp:Transcript_12141/g.29309  ORF Transcript_12141/g.29309 Transcript_12141/m.29309 type:complete len:185 (-) Transcript_12141:204-758(-)|eukprot:CAMPEP_0113465548 /NCGR_PEP_ID=MMETSP0014_2-20120614/13796_1 /TAXON_ID=2857 /ORGANISM="Nitzschia sp." /LENGTH=184 /DNA_ID=CAMNT_0000357709 /DNA_START=141 /DNA_END=695 /DNA_ORIENTATION=- /assembly_acc=CAM_ASM_000159